MKHRADTVQAAIVAALRGTGHSVQILSQVGDGTPDLLVGRNRLNILLETKTGAGKLSARQAIWHKEWKGQVATVWDVPDALEAVNYAVKQQGRGR